MFTFRKIIQGTRRCVQTVMIFKKISSQELPNSSSLSETSCNRGEETAQDQPGVENT